MRLAIDSSSAQGSVCLAKNGTILREVTFGSVRGRGTGLHEALQSVLQEASRIDALVVGTGPGSYNGIRSAIATAWGISLARQIPLHGVSSLLGIAEGEYCAAGDARRGQFYFAVIKDGRFTQEPKLVEEEELRLLAEEHQTLPLFTASDLSDILPGSYPRATSAARLALLQFAESAFQGIPEPIYLKAPHITQPKR